MALNTIPPEDLIAYKEMLEKLSESYLSDLPGIWGGSHPVNVWLTGGRRAGKSAAMVAYDEFVKFKTTLRVEPDLVATYKTEGFPAAEVKVYRQELDPRDPRHPNPKGGKVEEFVIKAADRASQPIRHLPAAKLKAKAMHEMMVAQLRARREEIAAERQLEELEQLASPINRF